MFSGGARGLRSPRRVICFIVQLSSILGAPITGPFNHPQSLSGPVGHDCPKTEAISKPFGSQDLPVVHRGSFNSPVSVAPRALSDLSKISLSLPGPLQTSQNVLGTSQDPFIVNENIV